MLIKDSKIIFKRKNNTYSIKASIVLILLLVFVLSMYLAIFLIKYIEPNFVFKLNGNKSETIKYNTEYEDPGISLFINDESVDLSTYNVKYNVVSNLDSTKLGTYKLSYNITYDNKTYKLLRNIKVVDLEKPVINIDTNEVLFYPCTTLDNLNLKYSASDEYDGDLTNKVTLKEKNNKLELSVKDSSGNIEKINLNIKKVEEESPSIKINNEDNLRIALGSSYQEDGAVSYDVCGNQIKDIKIEGNVDTNNIGTYEIKYSVESKNGVKNSVSKTVTVYDPSKLNNKTVYLTFDDGPGKYTDTLLDILKRTNVKATFFVTAQFSDYLYDIKREKDDGHAVAVHSKTHNWNVYESLDTYFNDFNEMNNIIESYTGTRSNIFRFPGGSSNTISCGANKATLPAVIDKANEMGLVYFDWNVDSRDAENKPSDQIKNNILDGIRSHDYSVVLCHDIKPNTINVIEEVINIALEEGFTFDVLTVNSPVVHHGVNKCHYK